jgi:hypothetical protein
MAKPQPWPKQSDDYVDLLYYPKHTDHSIDVYEDLKLKNRRIGFIWSEEPSKIIICSK